MVNRINRKTLWISLIIGIFHSVVYSETYTGTITDISQMGTNTKRFLFLHYYAGYNNPYHGVAVRRWDNYYECGFAHSPDGVNFSNFVAEGHHTNIPIGQNSTSTATILGDTWQGFFYSSGVEKTLTFRLTLKNTSYSSILCTTAYPSASSNIDLTVSAGSSGTDDLVFSYEGDDPAPFVIVFKINSFVGFHSYVDFSNYQNGDIIPISYTYGLHSSPEDQAPPDTPENIPPSPGAPKTDFQPPTWESPDLTPSHTTIGDNSTTSGQILQSFDPGQFDAGTTFESLLGTLSTTFGLVYDVMGLPGQAMANLGNAYFPKVSDRVYSFKFMTYKGSEYYIDWTNYVDLLNNIRKMFLFFLYFLYAYILFRLTIYLIDGSN